MPKSIKNKKRSALKVESLEQRQLLAAIHAGSGTEVDSDVLHVRPDGSSGIYDQILLTGSTITVGADAGQVTRVDFLDKDGDIVRAEFAGSGKLTISLDDFGAAAAPEKYATTTEYVTGHATFRIEGSDETTNFTFYSLGSANVHNGLANPIFGDGEKTGGNNTANAARVVIEASDSALGSAFGGLRAANAVFSDDSGAVGIVAPDVQFQGPIIVGDIDASGNAIPVLQIGQFSANKTIQIAGGDLKQTNGAAFAGVSNVTKLISSSGMNSMGTLLSTSALANDLGVGASNITYQSSAAKVVVDGKTVTQAELDEYAKQYLNEVELVNWTDGKVFRARLIGDVTVTGDLGGDITTDVDNGDDSDADEFSIGNITVTGKLLGTATIESATSIGNVTVTGGIDLSSGDAGVGPLISTLGRANQSAAIGDLTFSSNVKLDGDNVTIAQSGVLASTATGGIGDISIAGDLTGTGANNDTFWVRKGNIGDISATKTINLAGTGKLAHALDGSIGNVSGTALTLTSLVAADAGADANHSIGMISATDGALVLNGAITADKSIGAISATKAVTIDADVTATNGDIGALSAGGDFTINGSLAATNGAIGNITASGGHLTIGNAATDTVTAKSIGNISVTGDEKDLVVDAVVTASATSIGNISVGGGKGANIDLSGGGNFVAKTSIGNITVAGGMIIGVNDAGEAEFLANKIGDISVTAHKDQGAGAMLQNVAFVATMTDAGTDAGKASAKAASIGNITIDASAKAGAAIADGAAATDANLGTGFSSSGSIGNVTFKASETGKLLAATTAGLVVRAGNSNMGADNDPLDTFAEGVNTDGGVSIGTLTINAELEGLGNGTAGTGLLVASGVAISDGNGGDIVNGTAGNAAITINATKLGSGGTIGAVTITNYDADTGTDVRGFANSTVLSGANTAFASGSVIIADAIASIDVATAVEVKHYTPTGQPLKGAVAVGAIGAEGGVDDLFIVVL